MNTSKNTHTLAEESITVHDPPTLLLIQRIIMFAYDLPIVRDMIYAPNSLDTVESDRSRRGDDAGKFGIGFVLLNRTNEFVLVLATAREWFGSRFVAW